MAPASSKIRYPHEFEGRDVSSNRELTNLVALTSILNALGRSADLVDSCRDSGSRIEVDKEQARHFCRTAVHGANGFTDQFNAAAKALKPDIDSYSDMYHEKASPALAQHRSQVITDLENPLKDIIKKSHRRSSLDLAPYQETLESLLSKISRAMKAWLDSYTRLRPPTSHSRRSGSSGRSNGRRKDPARRHSDDRDRPERRRRHSREHEKRSKKKHDRSTSCAIM